MLRMEQSCEEYWYLRGSVLEHTFQSFGTLWKM